MRSIEDRSSGGSNLVIVQDCRGEVGAEFDGEALSLPVDLCSNHGS